MKQVNTNMAESTLKFLEGMGFKPTEQNGIFTHKMFEHGLFDFSATDQDPFWIMSKVFSTCILAGERLKAEKIRKELNIF